MKGEREFRRKEADRAAAWREANRLRPDTRILDRLLLDAAFAAVADRDVVPPDVALRVGQALLRGVEAGCARLGYDHDQTRAALADRINAHAAGAASPVRAALAEGVPAKLVRRCRVRRASQTG